MKMTIANKLYIGFGILVLLLIIMALLSISSLSQTQRLTSDLIEYQIVVQATNQCKEAIFTSRVGIVQTYLTGTRSGLSRTEIAREEYDKWWDIIKQYRGTNKGELLQQIETIKVEYDRRLDIAITSLNENPNALDRGDSDVIDIINSNLDFADSYAYSTMLANLDLLHEPEQRELETLAALAHRRTSTMTTISTVFGFVSIILAVGAAYFISGGITSSASALSSAADTISRGDLDSPISISTGDEMEILAESIERMRISLKTAIERLRR